MKLTTEKMSECKYFNQILTPKGFCYALNSLDINAGVDSDDNSGLNFINILRAAFSYKSVSKVFFAAFLYLQFDFENLRQNIGAKATQKVLVKLTTSVNIVNNSSFFIKRVSLMYFNFYQN
jgi:hypothetical protein